MVSAPIWLAISDGHINIVVYCSFSTCLSSQTTGPPIKFCGVGVAPPREGTGPLEGPEAPRGLGVGGGDNARGIAPGMAGS
jgi:hypothetical protein